MKVALVHDWLTGMRGGERCLEAFLSIYPEADIHTLVHVPGTTTDQIDARVVGTSFLNRIPGIAKLYRGLLPLFPFAARSLDLSGYDLVISLSHAAAKNVRVPEGVPHICYCFTPMRYIWDQAPAYFPGALLYLAQPLVWPLRMWDRRGAARVTEFVAISSFVAARIRRFYKRRAVVIPPPVRMQDEITAALTADERRVLEAQKEPFFLCAGALVPYKRVDVAVDACTALGLPLWVVGKGPDREKLEARAGACVRFFGHVSEAFLWACYTRCRALLFPGIEDFGIIPVECLSAGTPVVAIHAGGVAETVEGEIMREEEKRERSSGVLLPKSTFGSVAAFADGIRYFMSREDSFDSEYMRRNAQRFEYSAFFESWRVFAEKVNISVGASPRWAEKRSSAVVRATSANAL